MSPMSQSGGATLLQEGAVDIRNPQTGIVPVSRIQLSIVVTVFTETFSIRETVQILLGKDRGYISEIILLISPRASEEAFAICRECIEMDPRVKIQRSE